MKIDDQPSLLAEIHCMAQIIIPQSIPHLIPGPIPISNQISDPIPLLIPLNLDSRKRMYLRGITNILKIQYPQTFNSFHHH